MISFLSKSIALFLYKNEIIDDEKLPVCEYGFEIIVSTVIGFFLVALSGILLNEFISAMIFYGLFVCVRLFTGGYHATTHFRCKLTLLTCCLLVLISTKLMEKTNSLLLTVLLLTFYLITVILFSPIEHINAPITDELKMRNRKISIIMAIVLVSLILLEYKFSPKLSSASTLTLFIIAILILVPKIQERRQKHHEKSC